METQALQPHFWVMLVLLATAVQPILVKLGYRGDASPLQLLIMKNLVSALACLIYIKHFRWLRGQQIGRIARVSVLLLGINGLSLVALQHLPAVIVVTMTTMVPVFVAGANYCLGRERLGRLFWLGVGICFIGVMLTIDVGHSWSKLFSGDGVGYLAVIGAISCAVSYRVNMEALTMDFPPQLLVMWAFWINAVVIVVGVGPFVPLISQESLSMGLAVGASAAIANMAFLWSIRLVGSTMISVLGLLQRPIIILATSIILSESLLWYQWLGIALVLAGLPLAKPERLKVKSLSSVSSS